MKIKILIFVLIVLTGCKKNVVNTDLNVKDTLSVAYIKDSTKSEIEKIVLPNDYYLFIDSIKWGNSYTDTKGNDMIFRLIFSSCEETQSLHAENIQIVDDGVLKLIKTIRIPDDISGIEDDDFSELVKWEAPEEVVIKVINSNTNTEKMMSINLLKRSALEIK